MKSIASDKKLTVFDTKSKETCRTSTRILKANVMKSIAFDEKSLAVDTKSNKVQENLEDIIRKSLANQ